MAKAVVTIAVAVRVVKVTAVVDGALVRAVRVMARVEGKVRVVEPIRVTLISISTKTSIVMAMVAARAEAVNNAVCKEANSRRPNNIGWLVN